MNQKNVLIVYLCCIGASVYGGSETYPVYCFWVGKAVVHVPAGGDLKLIVMFPSTGECMVLNPVSDVAGGRNWPAVGIKWVKTINAERSIAGTT